MLSLNPSYYGSVFVTPKTIVEKYINGELLRLEITALDT